MKKICTLAFALLLATPFAARAIVPATLAFSARIADAGKPVTGSHTFEFSFWDCDGTDTLTCFAPDNLIWTEVQTLTVSDGVVSAVLGADTTTPNIFPPFLFNGGNRWLSVSMDSVPFGPFMAVHSVPYAFRAGAADSASSVPWTGVTGKPGLVQLATAGLVYAKQFTHTDVTAGAVVAQTNDLRLERDGTNGGFRVSLSAVGNHAVTCTGVNSAGGTVNAVLFPTAVGTTALYSNASNMVYIQCQLGLPYDTAGHRTVVSMNRFSTDYFWATMILSTYATP